MTLGPNLYRPFLFLMQHTELNNMTGPIPTEIGLLDTLIYFDIDHNRITGTIPTEICRMTELRGIALQNNKLRGELPTCVDQFENLQFLNVT